MDDRLMTHARAGRAMAWRLTLLAALAVAFAALAANTAHAHMEVERKSPARTATTDLRAVTMTFSGPLRSGTLRVFGPDGKKASKGKGRRARGDASRLVTRMKSGLGPGRYTVRASTLGADGHGQNWSYSFTLRRP